MTSFGDLVCKAERAMVAARDAKILASRAADLRKTKLVWTSGQSIYQSGYIHTLRMDTCAEFPQGGEINPFIEDAQSALQSVLDKWASKYEAEAESLLRGEDAPHP